jgi:hypothetical protein
MYSMKKFFFAIIVLNLFLAACSSQKKVNDHLPTVDLLDQQRYTFVARQVIPTEDARYNPRNMFPNASNMYQLTSRYDLRITPDSVVAYLPFFGRAYTAPINPSEGGIKFTSTNFSYKISMRKKNYEIQIIPNDNNEVRNLYLTVSPSGYASLNITSVNKTPIGYSGVIESNQ